MVVLFRRTFTTCTVLLSGRVSLGSAMGYGKDGGVGEGCTIFDAYSAVSWMVLFLMRWEGDQRVVLWVTSERGGNSTFVCAEKRA